MAWKNTNVFQYQDYHNQKHLYGDPLACRRRLLKATGAKLDEYIDMQSDEDTLKREFADEQLIAAVRSAFELEPINRDTGEGVTDAYCLDLLRQFVEYYEAKKAEAGTTPTS